MADVVYRAEFRIAIDSNASAETSAQPVDKIKKALQYAKGGSLPNVQSVLSTGGISLLTSTISYAVKKSISVGISTIGIRTGNSFLQEQVGFGMNIAQTLASNVVGGLIASGGNPLGAVAGLAVGGISIASEAVINSYQAGLKHSIDKNNIAELIRTTGLSATSFGRYSGSSGGLY